MSTAGRRVLAVAEALVVGAMLFVATGWLVPRGTTCIGMGLMYAELSADPFAFGGGAPQRWGGPLLAWCLGLGGARYVWFCHGTNALLLALAFGTCRARGAGRLDALLATAAVAATRTVLLYEVLPGFSDTLTFAALLAAVTLARHGAAFWAVQAFGLLHHEQLLLFAPWLLWQRRRAGAPLGRDLAALGVIVAAYAAFRAYAAAHAPVQRLGAEVYFGSGLLPWGTLGLLALTVADAAVVFGPLLPVLGCRLVRPDAARDRVGDALWLLGMAAIPVLAFDFHRFVNFLFLPLLLALPPFLARGAGHRAAVVLAVGALVALHGWTEVHVVGRFAAAIAECNALAEPWRHGTCVVPREAALVAGLAAIALGAVAGGAMVGWWLERRRVVAETAPPR